jgi:UDP-glucose:(heptosyl)LPS alpha-1,3-glucosyltransferase
MSAARRLRVAVLNRHFGAHFGGAEHYSVALAEELARRHDIHVFAQHIEHPGGPGLSFHRVPCVLAKPRWINQLWFAAWTAWATRRGFDLVHSHENTWHGQIQTVHVRPFRIGLFHGLSGVRRRLKWLQIVTSPRLVAYWFLEASRFRVRPDRRIVASSVAVGAETLAAYPHAATMLCVIPPGVTLPDGAADQGAARRRLGLPEGRELLLFVGNDYVKKGLPALLAALALLPEGVHLAVVGDAAHIPAFRKRAERLGLAARVHFLGTLGDMAPAYAAADLLVHPTTEDSYAMVVLEALAYRLPVVVSGPAHCGIAADLHDGREALILADPFDAAAIAAAIGRLRGDAALRAALAAAGAAFAEQRDWSQMARRHEALYREVA